LFECALRGGVCLRVLEESDASELYALVDTNRAHIGEWMAWVSATRSRDDILAFLRTTRKQLAANNGFQCAILADDTIIGVVGFHAVDWTNGSTSIGYWLAENRQGRGTMTDAVRALTDHAFRELRLNRVEIRVAVKNLRSRAIPERLGFEREGVLREAERLGERFNDLVVYSMLAKDWM
jgi:ribosomal-protein-serine acetyltransferase